MINIFGLEISPYAICFLMSFVVSFIIISFLLKKSGMPGNIIIYSLMLSVVLCIYGAMMYGVIYSGFRKGIMDAGFWCLILRCTQTQADKAQNRLVLAQ